MSLIKCPSCRKRTSDKVEQCSHCYFSFKKNGDEIERLKVLAFRKYRNKTYQLKMLSFMAIALAVVGFVPMIWSYAEAIDYGFNVNILNHWGVNFVFIGFALYVIVRIAMLHLKRNYKSNK